jgi:hypothetical protein
MFGGGNEPIEGLLGLFHALFGECAHFRRDLELPIAIVRHNIPPH